MDYDDNDFQSQNCHLGGEESSKISPVLRPYAIPKFDFDDGLQGHLRFDSLVENEVFLGIPSQEDNQWIEDFSRGSSGIEFSSGAAESCSISRHNNVWSEATSSESVEMLLKSVGQEEMVPGESIIEDLDGGGKIDGLTQQMEPHMEQGDNMKDVMNSGSALPSDGIVEHASRLNDIEDTSKIKDSEYSTHASTQELDPNMSSKGHGEIVTEKKQGVVRKSDDANQIEVDVSVNEPHESELHKGLSGSVNEPQGSEIQHNAGSIQVLETQESEGHVSDVSFENAKNLSEDTCKAGEKHALSEQTETENQIFKRNDETCSYNLGNETSSNVDSTKHHGVEASIGNFEESSSLPQKGEDNVLIVGGCSESHPLVDPGKPGKHEPMDLSNHTEMHQQSNANNYDKHVLEISNANAGILASSEIKIDLTTRGGNSSVEALEKKSFQQKRDIPLNNEESIGNPETSLICGIGNKHFDGPSVGSSGNYVGDCSSLTVESSTTELLGEKQAVKNVIGVDDASVAQKEDLNAEGHASSPEVVGSLQGNNGNLISNTNDMQNSQDYLSSKKENAKVPDDTSDKEHEIVKSLSSDKGVQSSQQGVDVEVNDEVIPQSDCVATCGNDPVLDVAVEKADLVHGIAVDQVTGTVDKRKAEDESLTEANLLSSKKTSEGPSELGHPASGSEKSASYGSSENEVVNKSLVTKKNFHSGSGVEQPINFVLQTVDHSLPVVETSNKLECTMPCDSAVKESGGAQELVIPGNPEMALEENPELASSKVEDSTKSGCSTPTITSNTALSQSDKDKKEGVEGSISNIIPFPEVDVQFTAQHVSSDTAAKDDRSATVEVHTSAALSEPQASKELQSTKTTQTCKLSVTGEISPSSPSAGLVDPKMVLEPSGGSSQVPDGKIARGGSKSTPQRKTRRASGRSSGKVNAKKANVEKETTPVRQSERGDKSYSSSGTSQVLFEGLKPHGTVEHSGAVLHSVVSVPTSNSPDLTTSAPVSVLFQQPFTDLQQVQLRAQIFVYGSLIQGVAPEEACMVSAFGASDGGRSDWVPVWRASVERIQGHKSHPSKAETPVKSRSGGKLADQSVKQGARQSKVASSSLGQTSSKGTPPPVVNSMMPISSPLWNISTPSDGLQSSGMPRGSLLDYHQTVSPLHPFQTPASRSFVGATASWLSQSPFPGPWISPQTSSVFDASGRFSLLPPTETVKLTPVKEPSVSACVSSGTKHVSPSTVVHSTGPSFAPGALSLSDMKKSTLLSAQNSTDQKSRKRKKVTVSDDLGQVSLIAQTQLESVPAPVVTTHLSTSVVVSTPACFSSKGSAKNIVTTVSPTSTSGEPKRGEQNAEHTKIPEETSSKVEHAKRQAEDAANLAADAVSHSQSVWSQLDKQKSSLLVPDLEAKLTSAAVAVTAAAAVAKAAAAAAKVASNAALQAKLMAEEALMSSTTINPANSSAASLPNVLNNLGKATPASILKGDGSNSSSSIIIAAKEAARRRLEAASAASKHAENLDAIVLAAELAAKAVSQVGKIVAMGSPSTLNELLEVGPEGYWRTPQQCMIERSKTGSIEENISNAGKHFKEGLSEKGAGATDSGQRPLPREVSRESTEDHMRGVDATSNTFTTNEKDSRGQRSRRASDLAKTIGVIPESEIGLRSGSITEQDEYEKGVGILKENSIKEGSLVEVLKDGDGFKTAWYAANVLSLKDGKAFVSYTGLQSDEGSGQLKEWVALEGEANSAPKIRIAHPMTAMRFEGMRKRRRAAMGGYSWSIGDRVDVWTQDSWREGVVTDKNKKDETTLTVQFPAEGETSVVKVWHLRPTLIWKDGVWTECSSSIAKGPSSQGDTPQEKRLKLGTAATEGRGKDKMSKDIELLESGKPDESPSLSLAANEKIFNVGKNAGDENKPNRTLRTGLQKGGSRVVFGVPKPGKKRKFMEVSKHYTAERSSKTNESTGSVKFAKHPPPQESGTRGAKINARIDSKEGIKSKARVNRSGKPLNVPSRTVLRKDKFLTPELPAQTGSAAVDSLVRDSVSNNENEPAQENLMEFGSVSPTEGAAEENGEDGPSKKMAMPNAKSEQANRGKLALSSGKVAKAEVREKPSSDDPGKTNPEAVEPRRSNRRIQPTSRLLEGLQSSLIISKIPAVSQSHRSQNRGTSKGNNHG